MTKGYIMPAVGHVETGVGGGGPGESWGVDQPVVHAPAQPLHELPFDRAALIEWMHHMVEARVPDGFPLPWDHAGPHHEPGPTIIPM